MQYTEKLHLNKPQRGDNPDSSDINILNENFDKIDSAIGVNDVKPRAEFPPADATQDGKTIIDENGEKWKCVKISTSLIEKLYTTVTEATKTDTGYEYCSDSGKWYKDGEEIEVITPIPENPEDGKYYTDGTTLYQAESEYQWARYVTEIDLPDIIDNATSTEISKYKGLILATGSAPATIPVGYEYATFES